MNKIHLYAAMLLLSCGAALLAAAQPANPPSAPWRSLLQDDGAPDWRGWKEPGLPAGWHLGGRAPPKPPAGRESVTRDGLREFQLQLESKTAQAGNTGIL